MSSSESRQIVIAYTCMILFEFILITLKEGVINLPITYEEAEARFTGITWHAEDNLKCTNSNQIF